MKCPQCDITLTNENKCPCGWERIEHTKDIKCGCGQYARILHKGIYMCWDCRANTLRGTMQEDWRDQLTREYCREHQIHKLKREDQIAFIKRKGYPI